MHSNNMHEYSVPQQNDLGLSMQTPFRFRGEHFNRLRHRGRFTRIMLMFGKKRKTLFIKVFLRSLTPYGTRKMLEKEKINYAQMTKRSISCGPCETIKKAYKVQLKISRQIWCSIALQLLYSTNSRIVPLNEDITIASKTLHMYMLHAWSM